MKKIFAIICAAALAFSCSTENRGYGYDVKTEIPVTDTSYRSPEKESWAARHARANEARYMDLYDLDGKKVDWCRVLKGEFDGHIWYVFSDQTGEFCVIRAD